MYRTLNSNDCICENSSDDVCIKLQCIAVLIPSGHRDKPHMQGVFSDIILYFFSSVCCTVSATHTSDFSLSMVVNQASISFETRVLPQPQPQVS